MRPNARLMITACSTSASASACRRAPIARAIADEMPPPIAPPDSICIIMKPGNTSAMPASASVPRRATNQVSISPLDDCAIITSTVGHASHSSVGTMRPCSSNCVRGLCADCDWAGAETATLIAWL